MCKSKPKNAQSAMLKLLLLSWVFMVGGCAVKFVYNQLDWAIPWYLSDYISLDGSQEDAFDQRLEAYLRWHRTTQLPEYAVFLEKVADDLESGMKETSIRYVQDESSRLGRVLLERLVPDMVMLFQDASDEQVDALFEKFAEDNEEYKEKYIEPPEQEQRNRRARETAKYVERWTGRLRSEQKDLIREGTEKYALMGAEFLQARLAWQAEFRRILAMRSDKEAFGRALTHLLLNEAFGQTAAFQRKFEHNQQLLVSLYLRLDKTLTERQRDKAVEKLRSYAEDFYELAAED